jgi:hypothetical protein
MRNVLVYIQNPMRQKLIVDALHMYAPNLQVSAANDLSSAKQIFDELGGHNLGLIIVDPGYTLGNYGHFLQYARKRQYDGSILGIGEKNLGIAVGDVHRHAGLNGHNITILGGISELGPTVKELMSRTARNRIRLLNLGNIEDSGLNSGTFDPEKTPDSLSKFIRCPAGVPTAANGQRPSSLCDMSLETIESVRRAYNLARYNLTASVDAPKLEVSSVGTPDVIEVPQLSPPAGRRSLLQRVRSALNL